VSAIKHENSGRSCHLEKGDWFLLSTDGKGNAITHTVTAGSRDNIGTITGARLIEAKTPLDGITSIQGVIQDDAGNPVNGASVYACIKPKCSGKLLFNAKPSGADGSFSIRVHEGGTFYLRVEGGKFDSDPKAAANRETVYYPVSVKTGETKGGQVIRVQSQRQK
jgi:hypothetical protein